jgi:tol-pal system protein YbgF
MTMKKSLSSIASAAIMAATLGAVALPAQAAMFPDNEARQAILELRTQIDAINKRLDELAARTDAKTDKSAALDLASENEQLRQEIARLRGQIEVLGNEVSNDQRRQKDFYVDLDNRLRRLEPQRIMVDGKEFEIAPDEQKSYDAALTQFKAGDYKAAENTFTQFLQRYPASGYAPSAHYWLGNAQYVQGDYRGALKSHEAVIQNYPDSPKTPEAMLSIASSYTELKDNAAARKALEALIKRYPNTEASETAKRRLASLPAVKTSAKR